MTTAAAFDAAFNFADLQGLGALRREAAAGDSPKARRAVAEQFEALFLNLMLKQMRDASVFDGGLVDRERMAFHEGMLDQQLALTLSRGRGIGLADSIMRAFGEAPAAPASAPSTPQTIAPTASTPHATSSAIAPTSTPISTSTSATSAAPAARTASPKTAPPADFRPGTPDAFVDAVWPHAEKAARELGVPPDVLVAQAALETGWGRSMIRGRDGTASFNLFGIKAGAGWDGARAVVTTLEFEGGVPQPRREPFRVYANVGDSFDDYVALVKGRSRYSQALDAATPEDYVRALQAGGYATDPHYADKILAIVDRGLPGRPARTASAGAERGSASGFANQVSPPRADNGST